MHLDLRYPIGLLLTLYGVILAIQGLIAGAKVLGLNVNLYWGVAMTVCGLMLLYFARRKA
jgi:predicted Co/Zn/Cd cation transporter (cation efflux family)